MRKLLSCAIFLAAGCGSPGDGPSAGNASEGGPAPRGPVQTATLVGLYESAGSPPSQLCITGEGRASRFGVVTRRDGRPGCSGAGAATRDGTRLRLVMDGDSACTIEALIEGGRVTFPGRLPRGCSYYCAPGAEGGGIAFAKTGGTPADARRARDMVGDPLCT